MEVSWMDGMVCEWQELSESVQRVIKIIYRRNAVVYFIVEMQIRLD